MKNLTEFDLMKQVVAEHVAEHVGEAMAARLVLHPTISDQYPDPVRISRTLFGFPVDVDYRMPRNRCEFRDSQTGKVLTTLDFAP